MELYRLVVDFYGVKATSKAFNSITKEVTCVLYETSPCSFNVKDRSGAMLAAVILPNGKAQTRFFGKTASFETDPDSMRANLDMVDEWCRTQLTDKFLARFSAAYPTP